MHSSQAEAPRLAGEMRQAVADARIYKPQAGDYPAIRIILADVVNGLPEGDDTQAIAQVLSAWVALPDA
jgi:hypothetical protein